MKNFDHRLNELAILFPRYREYPISKWFSCVRLHDPCTWDVVSLLEYLTLSRLLSTPFKTYAKASVEDSGLTALKSLTRMLHESHRGGASNRSYFKLKKVIIHPTYSYPI